MYGSPGKETARLMFGASGHVMKTESAAKRASAAKCFFDVTRAMIAEKEHGATIMDRAAVYRKAELNYDPE